MDNLEELSTTRRRQHFNGCAFTKVIIFFALLSFFLYVLWTVASAT